MLRHAGLHLIYKMIIDVILLLFCAGTNFFPFLLGKLCDLTGSARFSELVRKCCRIHFVF